MHPAAVSRILVLLVLFALLLSISAAAIAPFDPAAESSLKLQAVFSEKALADMKFDLYLVAKRTDYSVFDKTGTDFASDTHALDDLSKAQWDDLALTLRSYAQSNSFTPAYTGKTDAAGELKFEHMQPGLYLIVGSRLIKGGYYYDAAPFLMALPDADLDKAVWVYDTTAQPKLSRHIIPDDTVTRKVIKVWDDAGMESQRPAQVAVQLLRDGVVYDTRTLDAKGNWRYTWNGLSPKYEWTVAEQDTEGYTSVISRSGTTFTITNTPIEEEPVPTPAPATPTDLPAEADPTLPQTGQLWWPVLPLAAAGLLLIAIGLIRRRGASR